MRHKRWASLRAAGRVLSSGARLRSLGPSGARLGAFGTWPSRLFGHDPWFATNQLANKPAQPAQPAQPANQQTSPTGPTSPTSFHLLRYPSFVDKNRRYVSLPTPRRRRVQKVRSCDVAFYGNATTLLIGQLESDSHIGDFRPREGGLSRGGSSVHALEPHQKGETAPHQLSSCSFSPLLRPRSSAHLLIYPSACSAPSRFRLAFNPRFSSLLLRAPSAPAPSPRVLGSPRPRPAYGSFGSPQHPPLCHAPAPFRTLAISAPSSRLSFPLLRLPRARFSVRPSIYPSPCSTPAP